MLVHYEPFDPSSCLEQATMFLPRPPQKLAKLSVVFALYSGTCYLLKLGVFQLYHILKLN